MFGKKLSPAHAAATFVVESTGDEGDVIPGDQICDANPSPFVIVCTLRAAIQEANALPGADTINFNIAGSGVQTIFPTGDLPVITEQVTINGYSQPGASPNTLADTDNAVLLIELRGTNAGFEGGCGYWLRKV